jgi:hypothetical protein
MGATYNSSSSPLAACGSVHSYLVLFSSWSSGRWPDEVDGGKICCWLEEDGCPVEAKVIIAAADDLTTLGRYSGTRESFSLGLMGCRWFRVNNLVRLTHFQLYLIDDTLHCACRRFTVTGHCMLFFTEGDCTISVWVPLITALHWRDVIKLFVYLLLVKFTSVKGIVERLRWDSL